MYIKKWYEIIDKMSYANTYKLAWGRAVIECIDLEKYDNKDEEILISYDDISLCILKYYWNQIFFFNLEQSSSNSLKPIIQKYVEELIEEYKSFVILNEENVKNKKSVNPIWFDKNLNFLTLNNDVLSNTINKISSAINLDVCYRFKNSTRRSKNNNGDIYKIITKDRKLGIKNNMISFTKDHIAEIHNNKDILYKLLNYKWAELLEKYNSAPRIISKVKGISNEEIKRGSLEEFKKIILLEFENSKPLDFYTGKEIDLNEISVDHVIPWSFIYSDDIWNLVITTQSNNSSKGNKIPSQDDINRLKERNNRLLNLITDKKEVKGLKFAIENKQVDKFFINMKG